MLLLTCAAGRLSKTLRKKKSLWPRASGVPDRTCIPAEFSKSVLNRHIQLHFLIFHFVYHQSIFVHFKHLHPQTTYQPIGLSMDYKHAIDHPVGLHSWRRNSVLSFCTHPTISERLLLFTHQSHTAGPFCAPWWRHQMETLSALLVLCVGNSPVTGEFPSQRPVTRGFDVFFNPCMNKRLSKQSRRWWVETPSRWSWRHCNGNNYETS